MILINRKTGQIVGFTEGIINLSDIGCKNVAEMYEAGWEEYKGPILEEEPKHWFISEFGFVYCVEAVRMDKKRVNEIQATGNYFATKEEAEKAVEKLKAWKRLKDTGAMFKEWFWDKHYGTCIILGTKDTSSIDDEDEQNRKDLDLLFGGEE